MNNNINVILIGDSKVGKTVFLNTLRGSTFLKEYKTTSQIERFDFVFNDHVYFTVLDYGKDHIFQTIGKINCRNASHVIIMVDVYNLNSYKPYVNKVKKLNKSVKIIIVLNKCDMMKKDTLIDDDTFEGHEYILICTKTNYNILKPFEWIYKNID